METAVANGVNHLSLQASPYTVALSAADRGNFDLKDATATKKVSEVLQENLDKHHILFTDARHNHVAHQILAIYALGASADDVERIFRREASYQRPRLPFEDSIVRAIADKRKFVDFLDNELRYSSFLVFFQREIEAKGPKAVLDEHLFANDDKANALLYRLFAGIMHPVIHLGYAFEFNQPAILAEALAMASVHERDTAGLCKYMMAAEKASIGSGKAGSSSLRKILTEARQVKKLREAGRKGSQIEKVKNVIPNAFDELVHHASQYTISTEQIEERMVEMLDIMTCTLATIPDTPETYKANFFLLHSVNSLVLWPSLLEHPWLSTENRTRLLEWQGRYNVLLVLAEDLPRLTPEDLAKCTNEPCSWDKLFRRAIEHRTDDGHLAKVIRALAYGEQTSKDPKIKNRLSMKGDMWRKLANLSEFSNYHAVSSANNVLMDYSYGFVPRSG
ncbi:hypothetical protein B0J12DRAFT_584101 [Macrophomina phaseolina]|uniref:Uncharacterized protein n=1 Tax=Macrophomina phaseolina TaxID=35725 RepID=A0ABQ8FV14_9PEZI|nr:hypothetical protein B0J12DRAFT_584101 [Macrophomina phaseolina]